MDAGCTLYERTQPAELQLAAMPIAPLPATDIDLDALAAQWGIDTQPPA